MPRKPVKDLPSELHTALETARSKPVIIQCLAYNDAVSLRHTLLSYLKFTADAYQVIGQDSPFAQISVAQNKDTIVISKGNSLNIIPVEQ